MTLLMATIDKFYAVMFPFKYGTRRAAIFNTAIGITTVPNTVLAIVMGTSVDIFGHRAFRFVMAFFNLALLLMFLTINILYTLIIVKIMRNQQNLRKVNDTG